MILERCSKTSCLYDDYIYKSHACVQNDSSKMQQVSADKLDEELTVARLYINKMKSEVKNVVQRCSQLEVAQVEGSQKLDEMDKTLSDNRLLIEQVCHVNTCRFLYWRCGHGKGKGKGRVLAIVLLIELRLIARSALQSRRLQLIGMR